MNKVRSILIIIMLVISLPLLAQEEEENIVKRRVRQITLQFAINYTEVNDIEAGEFQGRVGLRLSPNFSLGVGAGGYFSSIQFDNYFQENFIVEGDYAGAVLEPVLLRDKFAYVSFPVLLGVGQVAYVRQSERWNPEGSYFIANDVNWVAMPGVEISLSISHYVHLTIIGQYRFSTNVNVVHETQRLIPRDIGNNWTVGIGLKFGNFKRN